MKKILLTLISFTLLITACQEDEPKEGDQWICVCMPVGDNFAHIVTGSPSTVTLNGEVQEEWTEFSIAVTVDPDSDPMGGTYSVSGVPSGALAVWGEHNGGDWKFSNDDGTEIILGGIEREIIANATSAQMSFTIESADGRMADFEGEWIFTWQ